MKKENRVNKSVLRKYITDLMFKYKDKTDSILVLHEIFLWLNESWVDNNE
ncbi:hypothetical protein [Spiroplasma endosymbiont of Dactylopius coccus]